MEKKISKLKCLNPACNHRWFCRTERTPVSCPACKSRYWNKVKHWEKKQLTAKE